MIGGGGGRTQASVPPAVSTLAVAAFVEGGHRLVRRAGLDLHEVRPRMLALRTLLGGGVHVLPGCSSAQNIIHLLQLRVLPVVHLARDVVDVRAGVAGEAQTLLSLLHDQNVPAGRAEQQHVGPPRPPPNAKTSR